MKLVFKWIYLVIIFLEGFDKSNKLVGIEFLVCLILILVIVLVF